MRKRKIRFVARLFGMTTPIGVVKVATLAKMREQDTRLTCPQCGRPTRERKGDTDVIEHSQEYRCPCGFKTGWWGGLKRILRATGEAIEKPRLTDEKEIPDAPLYKMSFDRFRMKVSAVLEDNAVIPEDTNTAKNLEKIIIATAILGQVIVTKFNDTYEERSWRRTVISS